MGNDIRIAFSLLGHRKRKKLERMIGPGAVGHLVDLWINTAQNHTTGILDGMDTDDIALDANWEGDAEQFVKALIKVGFIDEPTDGIYQLHDWVDHQPYIYHTKSRSEKAKKAADARWSIPLSGNGKGEGYGDGNGEGRGRGDGGCGKHAPSMQPAKRGKYVASTTLLLKAWNQHTDSNLREDPPSTEYVKLVTAAIKRDPEFEEKYDQAAPVFKDVDDSDWSSGKVCFTWSLRSGHIDRILEGGYKLKGETKQNPSTNNIGTQKAKEVWAAIAKHGRANQPDWKDATTSKVITDMGGWYGLCQKNESERPWFLKEFAAAYGASGCQ